MSLKHYYRGPVIPTLIAVLILLAGISGLQAQTKQLLTWQEDLAGLQNASGDELIQNREAIQQIRNGIEFYLKFHPSSTAALPPVPPQPWGVEDTRNQVAALRQVLETIIKNAFTTEHNRRLRVLQGRHTPVGGHLSGSFAVPQNLPDAASPRSTGIHWIPGCDYSHIQAPRYLWIQRRPFERIVCQRIQ
jgi:hypothetical protein